MRIKNVTKIICTLSILTMIFSTVGSIEVFASEDDIIANDSDIKVTNSDSAEDTEVADEESDEDVDTGCGTKPNDEQSSIEGVIPNGIVIGDTDVSGKSAEDAQKIVDDYVSQYEGIEFELTVEKNVLEADTEDIGLCVKNQDVVEKAVNYGNEGNLVERYKASSDLANNKGKTFDLSLTADVGSAAAFLEDNKATLVTEAVDNTVKRENGKFVFVEGTPGTALKTGKSAMKIADYIEDNWDGKGASIEMLTEDDVPEGTEEELSQINDLLAGFSTNFGTVDNGRTRNVKVGASKLDGLVVYPGQTVSVSDTIGPTTAENGYFLAGSYENGTTVETYGGGICQVSSTLYNAVIRAELEVVTRSAHSMIVNYVEPSMDAAIAEGIKDFQFKNNGEYPIYIEGYTSDGNLYFNIYGKETRPANRKVEFVSEVTAMEDPGKQFVPVEEQPIGYVETTTKAHIGYTARLWKIEYVDGVETSRKIFNNSKYKPAKEIVSIGVGTANPDAKNAVLGAIATNDEVIIMDAVAKNNDGAVAAQQAADQQAAQQAAQQQAAQQAAQQQAAQQAADEEARRKAAEEQQAQQAATQANQATATP
ncbi:MAG: VanW family protein [Lachnospiraceae bacterium]|nr:VanW family protein [Lachnospiraceae bacterium]